MHNRIKGIRRKYLDNFPTKKEEIKVGDIWYVNYPYEEEDQIKEDGDSEYGEVRPGLVVGIDESKKRCFKVIKATFSANPRFVDINYLAKVGDPKYPIRLNCKSHAELSSNNFCDKIGHLSEENEGFKDAKTKYEKAIEDNESVTVTFENTLLEGVTIGSQQNINKGPFYRVTYEGKGIYQAYKNTLFKDKKFDEWKKFKSDPKVSWLDTPTVYGNDKVKHESYFTDAGLTKFKKETLPLMTKVLDSKKIQYTTVENLDGKTITYHDQFQVVVQIQEVNKELIKEGLAPVRLYNYVPFIPEKETDQQPQVQNESNVPMVISNENQYIGLEEFKQGKYKLCFITGMSGGGKTTLAKKLSKETNSDIVSLDAIAHAIQEGFSHEYLCDDVSKWLEDNKYDNIGVDMNKICRKHFVELINYLKQTGHKFIIEGCQIPYIFYHNKEVFKNSAIVFVNTSILQSVIRRYNRDQDKGWFINKPSDIPRYMKMYYGWYKSQNDMREYYNEDVDMIDEASKLYKSKIADSKVITDQLTEFERKETEITSEKRLKYIDVKYDKDNPIGFIVLKENKESDEVTSLYIIIAVVKEARGKGIADELFKNAFKWFKNSKYEQLFWTVHIDNKASNKFAKKHGFSFAWSKDKGTYNVYIITNPSLIKESTDLIGKIREDD